MLEEHKCPSTCLWSWIFGPEISFHKINPLFKCTAMQFLYITGILSAGFASAYDLPDNLKQVYDNHKVRNNLAVRIVNLPF
jgi:hypothetical protein